MGGFRWLALVSDSFCLLSVERARASKTLPVSAKSPPPQPLKTPSTPPPNPKPTRQRLRALPLVRARPHPQLDALIVRAARQQLAPGVPRHHLHVGCMRGLHVEALELVAGEVLPQPDSLVAAAGGEGAARGAEGGALDLVLVALECCNLVGDGGRLVGGWVSGWVLRGGGCAVDGRASQRAFVCSLCFANGLRLDPSPPPNPRQAGPQPKQKTAAPMRRADLAAQITHALPDAPLPLPHRGDAVKPRGRQVAPPGGPAARADGLGVGVFEDADACVVIVIWG